MNRIHLSARTHTNNVIHRWYSHAFKFSFGIPRSRSDNFYPLLLGFIRSESEERAKGIQSTLYQRSYHLSISSLYKQKKRESN